MEGATDIDGRDRRDDAAGSVSARDVLGVPALPPGRVSSAATRLRARVRRLSDRMAPPPVRVLESLFGVLDHRVLIALCDLGVPEKLTGPTELAVLARDVGADPIRLERLVRFAAVRGWLRLDRRGRVRPTDATAFLRRDHPGGWRAWVDFAGGTEVVAAIGALSTASDDQGAFARVNGAPFFAWMASHPDRWAAFDAAMAAGGRMHALTLAKALDWSGTRSICDVGGGTGALLATLLDQLRGVDGTLLELDDVVARAVPHPRMSTVAGDAFSSVPAGHDTYLLVNVLHDWSDADAVRILSCVAEAAAVGARIVVVDADHPAVPYERIPTAADVLMAVLTDGGRERNAEQFGALARQAGLRLVRSTRLASNDWAHELRR